MAAAMFSKSLDNFLENQQTYIHANTPIYGTKSTAGHAHVNKNRLGMPSAFEIFTNSEILRYKERLSVLRLLKIPKTSESLLFLYFSYYLFFCLFVCLFVSLFRTESLLIISSETTGRISVKLYMMIAYGLPSCMHILTC